MFYQNQHFGMTEYFCRETGENFNFPSHMHDSYELITVLEGCMTVAVGNREYDLTEGESVLVFPEQSHSLKSEKSRHLLVIFSPDIVKAFEARHASEYPVSNRITLPPALIEQIDGLNAGSSVIKMKAVLYSVCNALDEATEYEKKGHENGLLHRIFAFVEAHYEGECTLEHMSAALGYNRSYLSRYFSEATGTSFIAFVNKYKISKACYLLRNTDKTVLECAYDCGYTSLRSFNRNFKLIGALFGFYVL